MSLDDPAERPPVDALVEVLPDSTVITDVDAMGAYRHDSADFAPAGMPAAVVLAGSTADVVRTMQWATAHRVPVVPRGAGSGLSGGASAIDGALVLSLARMNSIREIRPDDQLAVVEPGVINADLGKAVRGDGLFYPPDPSSFEISTLGGNLATNAGGLRCVKYGVTRDSVLGLEVVLADGRVITTGGRAVKNVAGYDLTGLFVGSEGTLGVITAATLRLRPAPPSEPVTMVASFPDLPSAGAAVTGIFRAGLAPSLLELIDNASINLIEDYRRMELDRSAAALLIGQCDARDAEREADAMSECARAAGADFVVRSTDPQESEALLEARRMHYFATHARGETVTDDVGVPRSALPELLAGIERIAARTGLLVSTVGHAGDGNMHPTFVLDHDDADGLNRALEAAEEICGLALSLGGTITGEHGVGSLKRGWLAGQFDEATYAAHRAVKSAFDPLGIMNPGKAI
ncbi:MAG TPA: FAD-linked oxidase C-terminal domain-containing protein [Mycobacteriales bacterium]|nr:FAD-linked oxidase C-terminal domain-containing protein [Mycobacteriales bacterium]